jgi:D-3-phosphoglycerate dehydrogenase
MKDGVYLLNCARGELVDEAGLAEALRSGKVAGAALDTFENEPPAGSPLLELDNVIATPHLGASTAEAQVEVAVDIARQVLDALAGRPPRYAVNMPPVAPEEREFMEPFLNLCEKLGLLHARIAQGAVERVELSYAGEIAQHQTDALKCAFLRGLLQSTLEENLNWVNAPLIADRRGIGVREHKTSRQDDYSSSVTAVVATMFGGRELKGSVFGRHEPRIVSIDSRRISVVPQGHLLLVWNQDKPGMIGRIGTLLGEAQVNIAGMEVGRAEIGGTAVMALTVDSPVPDEIIDTIARLDKIMAVKQVDFGVAETRAI